MISPYTYSILKPFRDGPVRNESGPTAEIDFLCKKGFIQETECMPFDELTIRAVEWAITPAGLDALSEFEQHQDELRQQIAENKTNRRSEKVSAILSASVGGAAALIVEHFSAIVDWIIGLLG